MNNFQLRANEDHRWSYMTEVQLARRLKKITKLPKLYCFITKAREAGNFYLYDLAKEREADLLNLNALEEIGNGSLVEFKAKVKEKWEVVKEAEILERYVDF